MTQRFAPRVRLARLGLCLGLAAFGCSTGPEPASGAALAGAAGASGAATAGQAPGQVAGGGGALAGGAGGSAGAVFGPAAPAGGGGLAQGGGGGRPPADDPEPDVAGASSGGEPGGSDDGRVPGIIAVGYGGLRVVSRDLGKSWKNETHWSTSGGDDEDLLRTIAYGNGVWVSAGWRLVTSVDGVSWTDHGMAEDVITAVRCPVTDGMAFGAGRFLVACGSNLASSTDGSSWQKVGPTPAVGGHPYLLWHEAGQQFVCSGDDGPSFVSTDGKSWTKISITKAHLCEHGLEPKSECPCFFVQGVRLTTEWGGVIRRSVNGTSFEKTYQDKFENNLFTEDAFGVGRVAP